MGTTRSPDAPHCSWLARHSVSRGVSAWTLRCLSTEVCVAEVRTKQRVVQGQPQFCPMRSCPEDLAAGYRADEREPRGVRKQNSQVTQVVVAAVADVGSIDSNDMGASTSGTRAGELGAGGCRRWHGSRAHLSGRAPTSGRPLARIICKYSTECRPSPINTTRNGTEDESGDGANSATRHASCDLGIRVMQPVACIRDRVA